MAERQRFPLRCGVSTLVARESLSPRMIRVTLQAEDFGPEWPIRTPGEVITLLFLSPDEEVVLPLEGWRFPEGVAQEWRNYTVRAHDPAAATVDIDVVLHYPRGPACTWASETPIGGAVGYAGPRVDYNRRDDAEWLLLCGDETALPAIAAILEDGTPPERMLALIEVHDAAEELPLALPDGAEVRWIHRDGAPAGTTSHLADAMRAVELPEGPGQVWGATESHVARDLRTIMRGERGLPTGHVKATGYWLNRGEDWMIDEAGVE